MWRRWLIAPIRFYQRYLSPLKRTPSCRFLPTCSTYAIEAIEHHGVVVGLAKALWRLLRCNPLVPGGYDPVVRARRPSLHPDGACAQEHVPAQRSESLT